MLSDKMRARAKELDDSLKTILAAHPEISNDFIGAVKAAVVPELMLAMADMFDNPQADPADAKTARLRRLMRANAAIREAVAKGDGDELGRIAESIIDGTATL